MRIVVPSEVKDRERSRTVDKLLLTPPEAATMLSIGRTKLYDLLRTGALFSIRLGGSRRIPDPRRHRTRAPPR